jgi:succinate-semialdehyde dehydrogenase/glutarate-semialdehyde dehydrogenase
MDGDRIGLKRPELLKQSALIGSSWCGASDGKTFAVTDPATGGVIGQVPDMTAADAHAAIDAAHAAWPAWRARSAKERAGILRKWFDLILANADDLALIMTTEQGKPLAEAKGEIGYAASFVEWFAEQGKRIAGEVLESPDASRRMLVLKESVGVCAAITPWNFPSSMITRKVAPALAAGCTMVVKPAEQTPFSALALGELALQAGLPAGVLNFITCNVDRVSEVGAVLTASPVVRKLSFTGSTEIGRLLMRHSAGTIKKLSLELGGNAPFIVFDDADLDAAVEGALASKYRNSGQTCVCANRLYVQAGVYEAFAQKLAVRAGQIKLGRGTEAGVQQGPLIDAAAVAKVEDHIADAKAHGAKVLMGGERAKVAGGSDLFFQPTILTGVTSAMKVAREETFGPVAPLFKFDTEADAIAAANATEFGLAAYFYANDVRRIWRVMEALESGMVGVNTGLISNEVGPFGGVKQSGLGREGAVQGIEEYLETKYVCFGGIGPRI